jgi:oxygen-independent coproporphyrinogen III oxidase
MTTLAELGITHGTINAYDQRIPRYTSYPTAPYWTESFGSTHWRDHIEQSSAASNDLSLYVHIPFCGQRCLFCACNVIITRKEGIASDYLDYVEREIGLIAKLYHGTGQVIQLHLGGGTPNYLTSSEMRRLGNILESHFPFSATAERSIEIDPRLATPDEIQELADIHRFGRISFGVQDFHDETQLAIGREQTLDATFANVEAARKSGFRSINIDLIYGLPCQTEVSWRQSLDQVLQLRPDRIALYNFAYLPGKLAHQRSFEAHVLPSAELKLQMFIEAHETLTRAGWVFIGMDHYALAQDSLALAQAEGTLRRNFMGYTTLRGTDMLAFGTSAISDFQGAFGQNVKKLSQYKEMLGGGVLPVERGMKLTHDDLLRRHVIEELMCNGVLKFDGTAGDEIALLVMESRSALQPLEKDSLVRLNAESLQVTDKGRVFLRNIAVVFDAYVRTASIKPVFSRAV